MWHARRRSALPLISSSLLLLLLVSRLDAVPLPSNDELCFLDQCANTPRDTFLSYWTCCDSDCCQRLRFWVVPGAIATVGFCMGTFFALCFQCR